MAGLGWMGLAVPEKHGGLGLGALDLALVLEELGRAAAPGPFLGTQLVIAALLRGGTLVAATYALAGYGATGLAGAHLIMGIAQTVATVPFVLWLLRSRFLQNAAGA